MSGFNTSTRKDDMSLRLRAQNLKNARDQTRHLEEDNRKMEERLRELKTAMNREKEERERQGGGFWGRGQVKTGSLTSYATEVLHKKPEKVPKENKKKKVKVLQDEPLDVPQRSNQPGTIKYIAQRKLTTGATPRDKGKGPKCGQCEDRSATLSCVQCSEIYCPSCFAAFHLKGALKQHRSVPLSASGPRVCMSPRTSVDAQSPRGSHASGAVPSQALANINGSEAAGPPSGRAPQSGSPPSLLQGDYDETESAASFQQALMAWRQGEQPSAHKSPSASPNRPIASPVKSPVISVDEATGTPEQARVPEIKFKSTLSYAERLMLKKHRRTELAETTTPRLGGQSQSSVRGRSQSEVSPRSYSADSNSQSRSSGSFAMLHSSRRAGDLGERQESFMGELEDGEHVDFQSLFEAVVSSESPDRLVASSSSHSNVSVAEELPPMYKAPATKMPGLKSGATYVVEEVSPFESWKMEHHVKSEVSSSTFVINEHKRPQSRDQKVSSRWQVETITEMYPSSNYTVSTSPVIDTSDTPPDHKLTDTVDGDQKHQSSLSSAGPKSRKHSVGLPDHQFQQEMDDLNSIQASTSPEVKPTRMSSRPKSSKSRVGSARNKADKSSRVTSARTASRLGAEGHLTKGPSAALSEIAKLAQSPEFSYSYQSPLEGFFLLGVEGEQAPPIEDRVLTPSKSRSTVGRPKSRADGAKSARGERETIKVSNRLYQMAPRSWRPDSSLGETVNIHAVKPDEEWTASYSYSGQVTGKATDWKPAADQKRPDPSMTNASRNSQLVFGDEMFTEQAATTPTPRNMSGRRSNISVQKSFSTTRGSSEMGQGDSQNFETPRDSTNITPTPPQAPRQKSASRRSHNATSVDTSVDLASSASHNLPTSARYPVATKSGKPMDHENSDQSISSSSETLTGKSRSSKDMENLKLSRQSTGSPRPLASSRNISSSSRPNSGRPKPEQIQTTTPAKSGTPHTKEMRAASRGTPNSNILPDKAKAAPRQSSYLSNKEAKKAVSRQESDGSSLQRPVSSTTLPTSAQARRTLSSRGESRPRSSTGGVEAVKKTKQSLQSMDAQNYEDTVVSDMMMSRLQEDGWMEEDDGGDIDVSMDYDDGDDITPTRLRSQQMKMLQKSTKENTDHWETDVRPFSGISMNSQMGVAPDTGRSTHGDGKAKRSPSSRPASTMSQRSGRESRAIVMDGEDLSCYDNAEMSEEQEMEDKQTLDKLEWELASDTGRLTADGQISRMSVLDNDDDVVSSSSSRSSTKSQRMSVDKDYDIAAKLQEDERRAERDVDDLEMRQNTTVDEDEVRALR